VKAAPFGYVRPGTVPGVLAELAAAESSPGGAKILAGGQSLVPVLAMRLGRPGTLVDINAVTALDVITVGPAPPGGGARTAGGTVVRIGATVRQRAAQAHPATAAVPLLRMALPWVGHREIRSRGTVCGSIAHADPAAELPAVACCLGGTMTVVSERGCREVSAADFFTAAMTTALRPDELLESVAFPVAEQGEGSGFAEVARRHGDFALAGVAVRVRGAADGRPQATVACFGVADRPVLRDVSAWVSDVLATVAEGGHAPGDDTARDALRAGFAAAAGDFAADVVSTAGDMHGSTAYRRRLISGLVAAELGRATARALAGSPAAASAP
jgi:2-furoyl-CoA dehydrogenase FAD binding subunit